MMHLVKAREHLCKWTEKARREREPETKATAVGFTGAGVKGEAGVAARGLCERPAPAATALGPIHFTSGDNNRH